MGDRRRQPNWCLYTASACESILRHMGRSCISWIAAHKKHSMATESFFPAPWKAVAH